jgi:hypothetical protein
MTWSPINAGPTNAAVFQLFWIDRTLVAATHGRGLFAFALPPPEKMPLEGPLLEGEPPVKALIR